MKKIHHIILLLNTCIIPLASLTQQNWQQRVNYHMNVRLDHLTHRFTGTQELTYFNNSPDALNKVYYHLFFNAFQPGSAMDIRSRWIEDPDPRVADRIYHLADSETGFIHVRSLSMDGKKISFEENETILEVTLDKPIPPGGKVLFEMAFDGQVPLQIRRCGRDNSEGIDYSMSQWYPKMCEYDSRGWHPDPYIGREFYGVWGDFEVHITLDKSYTIGATGILQNPDDIGKGFETPGAKLRKSNSQELTWHWKAQNVHDFVWAADPDYIHTTSQVPDGPTLHFFHQNDPSYADAWTQLKEKSVRAFQYLSEHFGTYPYPQYSFIQGGDGGMEYPMATLITGNRKAPSLTGVSIHEAAHSWYQGVLATNEALYPWMDEGFTSYAATETMNHLSAMAGLPADHHQAYSGYFQIVNDGKEEALDTHADHYRTNDAYGTAVYNKGEVYLAQLAYIIGQNTLNEGLLRYFNTWKFKHPTDEDFLHTMEMESGIVLDWYNEYFVRSTRTIDYSIAQVAGTENRSGVILERKGEMPMPIDLEVVLRDGKRFLYNIPLDLMRGEKRPEMTSGKWITAPDWKWVEPTYTLIFDFKVSEIERIIIDPTERMADIDRSNNEIILQGGMNFILEKR